MAMVKFAGPKALLDELKSIGVLGEDGSLVNAPKQMLSPHLSDEANETNCKEWASLQPAQCYVLGPVYTDELIYDTFAHLRLLSVPLHYLLPNEYFPKEDATDNFVTVKRTGLLYDGGLYYFTVDIEEHGEPGSQLLLHSTEPHTARIFRLLGLGYSLFTIKFKCWLDADGNAVTKLESIQDYPETVTQELLEWVDFQNMQFEGIC